MRMVDEGSSLSELENFSFFVFHFLCFVCGFECPLSNEHILRRNSFLTIEEIEKNLHFMLKVRVSLHFSQNQIFKQKN
jgi:hypothetical protein